MSLEGIRVIDLTRIIAGPFCTQLLADQGAEVIKIETAKGDPLRGQGEKVHGLSWYFASYNRNKKSIVIDLRSPEGKNVLKKLLRTADVLVENFRPGVLDAMGFEDEVLKKSNPNLIVCSISGFGADGPYANRPAFDFIAQALSGFMSVNGERDGPPLRSGLPISDMVVGLYGAFAVSSTLARNTIGKKAGFRRIDVSLTDTMISLLSFQAANFFATGNSPMRSGNDHQLVSPYGIFETNDGLLAIAPSNNDTYKKLLTALNLESLSKDKRIDSNRKRMGNRSLIRKLIEPVLKSKNSAYWIEKLNAAGVPAGPILSIPEVFEDPQVQHREMAVNIDHGPRGSVKMLGFPIKFMGEATYNPNAAPELGEHTVEVLQNLKFQEDEIEQLLKKGIIKQYSANNQE